MKRLLPLLLAAAQVAHGAQLQTTPMARVVGLMTELKAKIESDGMLEQKSYDKFACWCESTLGRKASDISTAKETIDTLLAEIKQLKAEIASHGAEISQLKKDIAANIESQKEATEVRDKGYEEFNDEKTENEQCTGALEAAIKVLTGAGEGKKAMMLQEAQLLSVVSGVRSVLKTEKAKSFKDKDLEAIQRFVQHPEDFVAQRSNTGFMSATQIANNPFGDYAPQSTQIQGILKGMYDAFTMDIEKDNAEESDAQKSYEELMATKRAEQATLEKTLETQELEHARKSKTLADSQTLLDDTKVQLEADEKFFETTKETCKVKAADWSERSRLRTEELMGIGKAIDIMSSDDAKAIFTNATTTFLQLKASNIEADSSKAATARNKVYAQLSMLARKTHNFGVAQLAVEVKNSGHFDKVIASIDQMIVTLREEEQDDIQHRDRCERAENKNANDMADLAHEMKKSDAALDRMDDKKSELEKAIGQLEKDIKETNGNLDDLLEMRNEAVGEFKQAMKDDADAVALLEKAIASLSSFYKRNKISMSGLLQKDDPEYSVDQDKAPTLSYEGTRTDGGVSGGAAYGGRKGETGGIVAIVTMLKEDLEKEISQGRKDDAKAQKEYEDQRGDLREARDAQTATKISTEKELSDLEQKMADVQEYKDQKGGDLSSEKELEQSLGTDCEWVKTHFKSRREKRQAEMDGLQEAKSFLAGAFEME